MFIYFDRKSDIAVILILGGMWNIKQNYEWEAIP